MKLLIILVLLSSFFFSISCDPVEGSDEPNPRTGDRIREGDLDDEDESDTEEITDDPDNILERMKQAAKKFWSNMKECDASVPNVSMSELDTIFMLFGKTNPLSVSRECVAERLEKASESICQGHRDLDTLAQKFRGYDERTRRLETAYDIALRQEDDYRNSLSRYSASLEGEARRSKLGSIVEGEWQALADVFRYESELRCRSRYYDPRSRRN